MKSFVVVLFVLMCLGQWYVPGSMIAEQESVLSQGKPFHFRTAPIDPSDPFRGKYITLSFEADVFKPATGNTWQSGQRVFAVIGIDEAGFAVIENLATSPPAEGVDYFETEVLYGGNESITLDFPFDRFYVEESKASQAEQLYWESARDSAQVAYAVVRIKDGKSALEDVVINDRSIVDIVREMKATAE